MGLAVISENVTRIQQITTSMFTNSQRFTNHIAILIHMYTGALKHL